MVDREGLPLPFCELFSDSLVALLPTGRWKDALQWWTSQLPITVTKHLR